MMCSPNPRHSHPPFPRTMPFRFDGSRVSRSVAAPPDFGKLLVVKQFLLAFLVQQFVLYGENLSSIRFSSTCSMATVHKMI
ncbi:hypothetical protein TorRG33x02_267000 [Trema orientale]|uniref:Uncharacterized protein n=1 Tax=Trema orientale TaxID=63057 RepID=A0A2P5D0M2_TREOI|nr:hypothetical protein TorRG33x02_267000 [Trema orientale]